jgi:hypothetical protein
MAGSNWQQLAGGSVNPYDVLRDDGTPTANYGQHVICDGGTVTLPSPKANEAVLVSNISQDTTVTTSTGLVEQESNVTHIANATDPVLFVSDGANWYVANNLNYLSAIPDVPTDGLLHRWNISDTSYPIVDTEGSNDLSQGAGGTFVSNSRFVGGVGYVTDGSDDYAVGDYINTSSFTLVWWTEPDVSQSESVVENGSEWPQLFQDESNGWAAEINGNFTPTVGSVSTSSLQMVAVRYDGATLNLDYNAGEDTGSTSVSESPPSSSEIRVGLRTDGSSEYAGVHDFGLWYDRYVSDSVLQTIYDEHPST